MRDSSDLLFCSLNGRIGGIIQSRHDLNQLLTGLADQQIPAEGQENVE